MKSIFFRIVLLAVFTVYPDAAFCQTSGITSGAVYTLKSKLSNKLLNVSDASMDNSAGIDCRTDTKSDAQRWIVTNTGNSIYTISNAASGKLLHVVALSSDSANVDQFSDTGSDDVKWIIRKAGQGSFYIKPAADQKFSLNLHAGGITDGTYVDLAVSANSDQQRWIFQKEINREDTSPALAAGKVFDAWYSYYNIESVNGYFWDNAEMMEVVLDAYEVTKDAGYITRFETMYRNFIAKNGADWQNNKYNDDIAWMVLVSVRGYLLTGKIMYLDKAKEQFDKMYARAFNYSYGGGMLWYHTKTTKNACINGPSMVACCYLARATGDSTYYNKAISLYAWSKIYLFDSSTGKVNDNVDLDKKTGQLKISTWSSTYNQGTYLGAATMLYKYTKEASYLSEAQKIALYIRDEMYKGKVMNDEDNGNDLPGFKGIFARYARMYKNDLDKNELVEWLKLNVKVAYNNRNSQNLIQTKWGTRTAETKPKSAFGCSTAVSLLMNSLSIKTIE
jgi:predicted alpha-1,6-mannanase (GH76 family)